ncbi:type II secretion system protein [Ureibacillus aquaedulcis]|uniref:Prepilin-type N-terminal cleavage/methylation domain-containing protein n=1 Tax=Ureibacillus aquaedulcis TaxID=3058421 RepID=A0ABT8GW86_9BACL|nr:prepilin-type N-terminal cleavage/methylation domain-containing protein [Ureibacillus sp. BA0131]MDN4495509.1 prepilin-type N-terminal cleavage/methylation domain-containing protein [Ureibacillus sp. BA0131]
MKNSKQSGISLVEVLAIIVLLSIVVLLSWSIFFQGANYTNKAISKNQMQQEANYIISKLNKIHLQSDTYKVKRDSCKFSIEATTDGRVTDTVTFENNQLCISIKNLPENVNPNEQDINLQLTIQKLEEPSNNLTLEALLQRLKEASPS